LSKLILSIAIIPLLFSTPSNASPLPELIRSTATSHGVNPDLAVAVAKVETQFNCKAVGRAGELGPMQIKPATARGVGVYGSLRDCPTAVEASMRYLKQALSKHGVGCEGISAYNRGIAAPGRCTKYGRTVLATLKTL
jgi:soluble lytic murein transglycosylase-like protein